MNKTPLHAVTACMNSDSVEDVAIVACSFACQRTAAAKIMTMWPPVDLRDATSVACDVSTSAVTKYGSGGNGYRTSG
eukprot:scaffold4550_cov170-Chaetoceros_neogracile.AAC.1